MSTPAEPDKVVYVRNAPDGQKALTMGILAICLFWLPLVNIIFGILAFIYGQDGRRSQDHEVRVKSLTGMILGAIGGFWWVALFMLMAAGNGV
ncbi:hypothetical protein [Saccharopolyspora mangrovi]|uniref:DUF4190 domain-containing protein n=1 Tax=Saccharopolyspora mangrovi TaxID=3082379 RepID=A0ABU6A7C4_9PSEU|nr:hypothetical protein [Saccharopolyspora sp. S2-29]MEB3367435.1 hypothetical protein [Saccharopolyspora sp. S2-29]